MAEFRIDSGAIAYHRITDSGFLQCYMRLAVAGKDLIYRSPLGAGRTEFISEENLFRVDSLETFIGLPITSDHPTIQGRPVAVDGRNSGRYARGANGSSFVREITPFGTFLGTIATIHDAELTEEILSGRKPGVSPGYKVAESQVSGDRHEQIRRVGNHIAACVNPRGGPHVRSVLEGLNVDSDDEIWWQAKDLDLYQIQIDEVLILPLMENPSITDKGSPIPIVASKTPIILKVKNDSCAEGDPPCGKSCNCSKCQGANKRMISLIVRDQVIEVDQEVADILRPELAKAAAFDDLDLEFDKDGRLVADEEDDEDEDEDNLYEEALKLINSQQETIEALEAAQEGGEISTDEIESNYDELLALAIEIVRGVDTLRADAKAVGLTFESGTSEEEQFAWLAANYEDAQKAILSQISPSFNTDSYEGEILEAVYDSKLTDFRENAKKGRKKKAAPSWLKKSKNEEDEDEDEDEEMANDSSDAPYGQLLLKTVGALSSRSSGNAPPSQSSYRQKMQADQDAQFGRQSTKESQ